MERMSPLAWAAIGLIVVIAVFVNAWMLALLRNKDLRDLQLSMRRPKGHSINDMQKFVRLLRNPRAEEEQQLRELSNLVEHLRDEQEKP